MYGKAWAVFLAVFNGPVWYADVGNKIQTFVTVMPTMADHLHSAARALCMLLFSFMPCKLRKPKRTSNKNLGWWMTAFLCNAIQKLWRISYGSIRVRRLKAEAKAALGRVQSAAESIIHEFYWHKLECARCNFLGAHLLTEWIVLGIVSLNIVFEPLKWLHRWFMRRSSMVQRARRQMLGKLPPICDFVSIERSPATRSCSIIRTWLLGNAVG